MRNMLEIIQFVDTLRYGIRNRLTGTVIRNRRTGKPYSYRSQKRAIRKLNRITQRLNKTIQSLDKG